MENSKLNSISGAVSSMKDVLPDEKERFFTTGQDTFNAFAEIVQDANSRGDCDLSPSLITLVGAIYSNIKDKEWLIESFIERSWKHWDKIADKDAIFFAENSDTLFFGVPPATVESVADLFVEKGGKPAAIRGEDLDYLFSFVIVLVKICIKYVHKSSKDFPVREQLKKLASRFEVDLSKC
jgi:hypothetical protein